MVDFLLSKEKSIFYVDIGANDPRKFNNTYKLYKERKARGIIIEPNPDLKNKIKCIRKYDKYIQAGIAPEENILTYYKMSVDTLNSFSKKSVDEAKHMGYEIIDELNIRVISTNDLIRNYISKKDVSFLNIDVEGMDFEILKSWDFKLSTPYIICIETAEFSTGSKRADYNEIIKFMEEKDYFVYADTYINTIFVNKIYMEKGI